MGIELNRPAPGHHRLGKSPAPTNPLDGLGASEASNGFADMMTMLSKDPGQLPAAGLALGTKTAKPSTAASFAATAHRSARTGKPTDLQALMSAEAVGGTKDAAAEDGTADVSMGAGTLTAQDGFLTPPSSQNPTGQSWQDLLLGEGIAGAAGGMFGVASAQPNPTPTSLDPKSGQPQTEMPAVTGVTIAGAPAPTAISSLASRQQPDSGPQSSGPLTLPVPQSFANQKSSPSDLPLEPVPGMRQVLAGLSAVPTAKTVMGPDGSVAVGGGVSDRTPQLLPVSVPTQSVDPSTPVAALVLSKPSSPPDAAPVASGPVASSVLYDRAQVNANHKADPTAVTQLEQPKAPIPQHPSGVSAAAVSAGQRLESSQLAAQQAVSVPTVLVANAVLARVDLPLVPAAETLLKPLPKRLGLGTESFYGQAGAVVNPLVDTVSQVTPAGALVAEGALAETVSYWATHGVQNATMQLDGLGSEPVEVHISLNGDQAQVDFRTNQVEVRQAIEAEVGQLKDLLLSQGLQLAGLSIGQSGQRGQADKGQKQAGEVKKITVVDGQLMTEPQRGRSLNLSVGQSLDLFV